MTDTYQNYQKRIIRVLDPEDQKTELTLEQIPFYANLYKEDVDFCRSNKINMARILRLQFHKWIMTIKKNGEK